MEVDMVGSRVTTTASTSGRRTSLLHVRFLIDSEPIGQSPCPAAAGDRGQPEPGHRKHRLGMGPPHESRAGDSDSQIAPHRLMSLPTRRAVPGATDLAAFGILPGSSHAFIFCLYFSVSRLPFRRLRPKRRMRRSSSRNGSVPSWPTSARPATTRASRPAVGSVQRRGIRQRRPERPGGLRRGAGRQPDPGSDPIPGANQDASRRDAAGGRDCALADWVETGAHWPGVPVTDRSPVEADGGGRFTAEERNFWAFRKVQDPEPPQVNDVNWVRSPVDRFVLARLEAANLRPAPPASRLALLRRASYDLTGLPPSEEQIADFLSDGSPRAFEKMVDRLLASPRYGERWGRHWLDVARYADSTGNDEDHRYPYAWRYRDYVGPGVQ